ncbi:MAG: MarR family transcriptional regulator [Candidatus Aminicenantes bacterium]|jgi:hypothetical protein|nr:MarR family transcriptional regulator [Candidatus Aminicenantes bacterium]
MGMKEKFMESMMSRMSTDEKKAMMSEMMEKFFAGISDEDKRDMMKEMMTRMAGGGAGEDMPNPMMRMMGFMMGGKEEDGGFNPMDMCKKMMATMGQSRETAVFATPEIRTLFEEWARQMDEELLGLLDGGASSDLDQLAARLKISKESLIFFLARLAQKGEIGLRPERVKKS